ncbi:hypothetical protein A2215_02960 [Candidatus Berkelbacteria bacterium RIFOXYA2_FULL_43_10]|uniref:Fibronectin type-III domain-containing protein n=1 Tax=Candidatus Berkelbacteria bacterium RIFOXYA2_FULL_43_10 TaxID=1797472 RepID=A0A1F5E4S8_9BACT|nr:MAG: hypothetical protein A2215_02960 [Candidatus Berkelbacteria bacterium RIFOXYA2_FULL_43_10]
MRGIKIVILLFSAAIIMSAGFAFAVDDNSGIIVGLKILGNDVTPPSNVSNLAATPGNNIIDLTWTNPGDADFMGVRIVKREDHYPLNEIDGEIIEAGLVSSYRDAAVVNGTRYYYAVFAYDTSHNYASGVLISEIPAVQETPATPTEPTPTPENEAGQESEEAVTRRIEEIKNLPEPTEINLTDINYYTILPDGLLELDKEENQGVRIYRGSEILISFDINLLADDLYYIEIILNSSHYLMSRDAYEKLMQTTLTVPQVLGDYDIIYLFHYNDGSEKAITGRITTVPYGYIYEESTTFWPFAGKKNRRVKEAVVTLYQKIDEKWVKWDGEAYKQQNPQVTNERGEYAYYAPDGKYYIKVERSGFYMKEGGEFDLSDQIINKNYKINRQFDVGAIMTVVLMALLILAVEYLFTHREKKRYSSAQFGDFPTP